MKILLTGASSFTGYWFARALAEAGHQVTATLTRPRADYAEGVRAERVRRIVDLVELVEAAPFGSPAFLGVCGGRYDVLAHHGALVGNYRDPDFDVAGALAANTLNLRAVLARLAERGLKALVLTGSVFEEGEGAGDTPMRAFSPYGVSKGLTASLVSHRCGEIGLPFLKFVIPNPFGPLEEQRFCAFLVRTWKAGETAVINTPDYVRDNIHVSLLARAYAGFLAEATAAAQPRSVFHPSGYVESQGRFADRFAAAMRPRLGLPCALEHKLQTEFPEPRMRVNLDSPARFAPGWSEVEAWDTIADWYR